MRLNIPSQLANNVPKEILPKSTVKVFRTNATIKQQNHTNLGNKPVQKLSTEYRQNEMNIQMLSQSLYKQIFHNNEQPVKLDTQSVARCHKNFERHSININESPRLPDVFLKLPTFKGSSIEEHFYHIANEQCQPYKERIENLLSTKMPPLPKEWHKKSGWTYYDKNLKPQMVPYPDDDAVVFDTEICMSEGQAPTIACALGKRGWYSWVSPSLFSDIKTMTNHSDKKYTLNQMIPMECIDLEKEQKPKIIIGHNVSFDRARIREQYLIDGSKTRFLDTMSLHTCISGLTSYQRAMLKANKEIADEDLCWSSVSSLNSLAEVYRLYCGQILDKEKRDLFVEGSLEDIRNNFNDLMSYCAKDVTATFNVLSKLYPLFLERFPNPATMAGMLEIGMAYLPVNENWQRYINESNLTYEDLNIQAKYLLEKRANQACRSMHDAAYKQDLWMWDQDWQRQEFKFLKQISKQKIAEVYVNTDTVDQRLHKLSNEEEEQLKKLQTKFSQLIDSKKYLPKSRPLLPGYPAWYRKLCEKPSSINWTPGPSKIGTGMQIVPKLLSLCWEGYPLHYIRGQGWGFIVPHKDKYVDGEEATATVPLAELVKKCPIVDVIAEASERESHEAMFTLRKSVEANISKKDFYRKKKVDKTGGTYCGSGIWCNLELDNCCWFFKLPHKDSAAQRVGNPLAKDFLNKFSENVLSGDGETAEKVINIAKMVSYWRNNRDRIENQIVVWSDESTAKSKHTTSYGAIIPQVVVCGTLTRRAMEPTWMTASNAQLDRVGSELRSMVQAPTGYRIVGADVDSQELWIASMLGDASETGVHGATPFGWMTLSGNKSDGSDMHSVTAKVVGISRDHAKVINYARIYGAGQSFAERLLKQFNPTMSDGEARSKATKMFAITKGKKLYYLKDSFKEHLVDKGYSSYEAMKVAAAHGRTANEIFKKSKWIGGTESAMFNRLEEIAEMQQPLTPFLQSRLSRALEPQAENEDRFLPTRVNWVVQSGAVDFLHLMLVCMRWLMGTNVRFCLSFHDELRYLVRDEYAYKAALAMHVTNLLTRAFCAKRVGLNDLPQSVAFFSSVEVDRVLRKDSHMDCRTPSNPHGLCDGYGVPMGESLNILKAIEKAETNDLSNWV